MAISWLGPTGAAPPLPRVTFKETLPEPAGPETWPTAGGFTAGAASSSLPTKQRTCKRKNSLVEL